MGETLLPFLLVSPMSYFTRISALGDHAAQYGRWMNLEGLRGALLEKGRYLLNTRMR
jgi:hypothetical protein